MCRSVGQAERISSIHLSVPYVALLYFRSINHLKSNTLFLQVEGEITRAGNMCE
jgi:hypothetical protein